MCLLFYHEESIHEVSRRHLERMDGQAKTNMLFHFFQSWEQNVVSIIRKYILLCKMVTMGTLQQSFRPGNKATQEYIVW